MTQSSQMVLRFTPRQRRRDGKGRETRTVRCGMSIDLSDSFTGKGTTLPICKTSVSESTKNRSIPRVDTEHHKSSRAVILSSRFCAILHRRAHLHRCGRRATAPANLPLTKDSELKVDKSAARSETWHVASGNVQPSCRHVADVVCQCHSWHTRPPSMAGIGQLDPQHLIEVLGL
jgi:hypothetical protein